ncbi:fatty acid desaturase [Oligoflexaceae bacterium]|nr:fatty acid desaturase [Oligoflexaceae bacterium]
MKQPTREDFQPPAVLNIFIMFASMAVSAYFLWQASHTNSLWVLLGCAVAFSFTNNTIFSLLHESVHKTFSHRRWLNESAGVLCAAFFPTGLTFQRICHLGHHCRNRTDHEMFDMYYPEDNRFLKFSQFYAIFTGIYWITLPIGCLLYLLVPRFYDLLVWSGQKWSVMKHTDVAMLTPFTRGAPQLRIKSELLFSFLFQAALFIFLDLRWEAWLACYWIFGMNWGSLQYADHAWSSRDIREGAWNLRINPLVRLLFLNYHHHLVHHRFPHLPWIRLGKFIDDDEYRPSFLKIYLRMWLGPTPVNAPAPKAIDDDFRQLIYEGE